MKNKLINMILTAFIFLSVFTLPIGANAGRNVNESITDISVEAHSLTVGEYSSVIVNFDATQSNTIIRPGDYIDLDFSKSFQQGSPYGLDAVGGSMNLYDELSGLLLARATISKDNVRITFTDNVDGLENVRGGLKLSVQAVYNGPEGTRHPFTTDFGVLGMSQTVEIGKNGGGTPSTPNTIQKLGSPSPGDVNRATWVLYVNANKDFLTETVFLTDTLGEGQTFDESSVFIRYMDERGNAEILTLDEFRRTYGYFSKTSDGFTLALNPGTLIRRSFEFIYTTTITDYSKAEYTNSLKGRYTTERGEYVSYETSHRVQNIFSSGTAIGTKPSPGFLRITKVEAKSETPIAGVRFGIYKDNEKIDEVLTNRDGFYDIELPNGVYTVKEIETVDWLVLDDTPQKVEINNQLEEGSSLIFKNNIKIHDLVVEKTWVGGPSPRPTVSFQLVETKNGKETVLDRVETLVPGQTHVVFKDLPYSDADGTKIGYHVQELGDHLEDYETEILVIDNDTLKVINKFKQDTPTIDVTVDKTWIGGPSVKPDIEIELLGNGAPIKKGVIKSGSQTYLFKDLPAYDSHNEPIDYSVVEVNVPEDYRSVVIDKTHIVNQYMYRDVTITKKWIGGPILKPHVTLELMADDIKINEVETNGGSHTFEKLPIYGSDDHEIVYSVREKEVPQDYKSETLEDNLTVVNTYESPRTHINATKIWEDTRAQEDHPEITFKLYQRVNGIETPVQGQMKHLTHGTVTFNDVPTHTQNGEPIDYFVKEANIPDNYSQTSSKDGLTITNTFVEGTTSVEVHKEWIGGPKTKPAVTFQLFANGIPVAHEGGKKVLQPSSRKVVFSNLPKYDELGLIDYTIEEVERDNGYVSSISKMNTNTFKATNTYIIETKPIVATKTWIGGPDKKPDVSLQLMVRSTEFPQGIPVDHEPIILKDGETKADFGLQPVTLSNGVILEYYVIELNPPKDYKAGTSLDNPLDIVNKYDQGSRNIVGIKQWQGGPKTKPTVDLELQQKNPETRLFEKTPNMNMISLKSGEKSAVFRGVPVRDTQGNVIEYQVNEPAVPENYSMVRNSAFDISNVYHVPTVDHTFTKVWVDGPAKPIEVKLFNIVNGELIAIPNTERTLVPGETEIRYTDIPHEDENGNVLNTVIRESNLPNNYRVDYNDEEGIITNTYDPEMTFIHVKKTWVGGPGPKHDVEIELYQDGKHFKNQTLRVGEFETIFTNLPVQDDDNHRYHYEVYEVMHDEEQYIQTNQTVDDGGTYVSIENTFDEGLASYTVNKEWKYGSDTMQEDVEIELKIRDSFGNTERAKDRNGNDVDTLIIPRGEKKAVFQNLPIFDQSGNTIMYEPNELTSIPNMFSYLESQSEYEGTITNVYMSPRGTLILNKQWIDGPVEHPKTQYEILRKRADQHNDAFESLDVVVALEKNATQRLIPNIAFNDQDGTPFEYRFRELNVPENYIDTYTYEVSDTGRYQTTTVTNTYVPATRSVHAEKRWKGGREQRKPIQLQLMRSVDGSAFEEVSNQVRTVDVEGGIVEYSDVPATNSLGQKYNYSVKELTTLENFETTYSTDGLVVTNKFVSPLIDVTGSKTWVNGPNIKPEIDISLEINGDVTDKSVRLEDGDALITFNNLPEFDSDGSRITYTFNEKPVDNYVLSRSVDGRSLTNTYVSDEKEVHAFKIWNDNDQEHPTIVFELLMNGIHTGVMRELESGVVDVSFGMLPQADENGKTISYSVVEQDIEGYESSISEDGLTITNTKINEQPLAEKGDSDFYTNQNKENPNLPKTGVNDVPWYLISSITVLAGIGIIVVPSIKRREI